MALQIIDQSADRLCGSGNLQQRRAEVVLERSVLTEQFFGVLECCLRFGQSGLDLRRKVAINILQEMIRAFQCLIQRSHGIHEACGKLIKGYFTELLRDDTDRVLDILETARDSRKYRRLLH